MSPIPDELWIIVGGNVLSALLMLGGGLFVLIQDWRRDINRLFFFITVTTLLYTVFFMVAAVQTDYTHAYFWWSLNICDTFIAMAVVHFIFRVIDRQKEWRWFIIFTYVAGLIVVAVALVYPSWFLPDIVPKLYFPYYLVGGWWYVVMLVYFFGTLLVAVGNLLAVYWQSVGVFRKRLEYFLLMLAVGYTIGCLNFLLVFNIPVDPIFGMFVGFYLIPVAYGIFATDLLDIRIVVRRAFYYALSIAGITGFLVALILLNDFLTHALTWLSFWTVPFGVAVTAFIIGRFVLKEARENERLKYEFITVATHKLRTPLTRIRWMIPELLTQAGDNAELREGIRRIDDANNRLIELTTVLLEGAQTGAYSYKKEPVDLEALAQEAVRRLATQINEKKMQVSLAKDGAPKALGDERRLASVIDVLVENAIIYTPAGGTVRVTVEPDRHGVKFSVADNGIGIAPEDRVRIFSSFFRTSAAKTTDTEGVGVGLSLSKTIIENQGGRIGVESEGEGKGSVFWFTIPSV